jgi:uncharacterized protein YidB (DUF937 family)
MGDPTNRPGQAQPANPLAAVGSIVASLQQQGGLDSLAGKLREAGLGDQVDSWIAAGSNKPVDPQRIGSALGPDTVNRLSASSGLSVEALLPLLAAFLPQIIDMLTPDGQLPGGGLDGAASSSMPDLGGLLGGLLGGGAGSGGQSGMPDLGGLLGGLGGVLGNDERR